MSVNVLAKVRLTSRWQQRRLAPNVRQVPHIVCTCLQTKSAFQQSTSLKSHAAGDNNAAAHAVANKGVAAAVSSRTGPAHEHLHLCEPLPCESLLLGHLKFSTQHILTSKHRPNFLADVSSVPIFTKSSAIKRVTTDGSRFMAMFAYLKVWCSSCW